MAFPDPPDPFLGEIRLFAGNFAPKDWALCDGRLLSINDNETLFTLFGTTYGGDGTNTFGLPDLRGRVPVSEGNGIPLGTSAGKEYIALNVSEMPRHQHIANCSSEGGEGNPTNQFWAFSSANPYFAGQGVLVINSNSLTSVGLGEKHENRIPFQAITYIMSLKGVYPN
jgi:microcystin-dependent protein